MTMIKFLMCLSLLAFGTAQATVIDTTTGGYVPVSPFGEPNTATFGQTITTDSSGGYLDNFSFYMTGLNENFKAYVYKWDGFKAVGNALYESVTTNIGNPGSTFQEVTFSPNILLAGSTQYVLFFSTSGFHDGITNVNSWGYVDNENAYIGGSFVYDRNGNDFTQLTTQTWDSHGTDGWGDLAFKLQITAVPEPSTSSTYLLGIGVLLAAFRRMTSTLEVKKVH